LQRIELQEREKTKLLAERVAHDIRSPLASLAMITQYCKGLSEKERTLLKSVATNIENITNDLLRKYKTHEDAGTNIDTKAEQYIFVDLSLEDMLASKNYQYKKENIAFNYFQNLTNKFVFIKGNSSDFCRMISNLINNSVESIEGKEGLIDINFNVKDGKVEIKIKDNGKGMSQEMVDNIMKDIVIGTSKEEGYGIGLQQVKSALKSMNSQMLVKSSENMGTEITLVFQESKPPDWFVNNIVLHKDDTVVVLDDDISIHNIWKKRFENYAEDITVKCFTQGLEAIDFMNSIKEKDKIFLLADYELRDQDINGVDVIEKTAMEQQSLLVTNIYISKIKDFNEKCKFIKILPKKYICDISIMIKK
jgi:FixJ family two-component response regulator